MTLQEIRDKDEWTIKEVGFIIGAVTQRGLKRKGKNIGTAYTNKMLESTTYTELTENVCEVFQHISDGLDMELDKAIMPLYSNAILWLEEHEKDEYDKKIKQYLIAGLTWTADLK